jgi:hypothetical protein
LWSDHSMAVSPFERVDCHATQQLMLKLHPEPVTIFS